MKNGIKSEMKDELIHYIENGLTQEDIGRIWILINSSKLTGRNLMVQIAEWKMKLTNGEHIEGTSWNIPDEQKERLWEQYHELRGKGTKSYNLKMIRANVKW